MRKTNLKSKTTLKATTKKRPKAKYSLLTDKADKAFSKYIRLRDSEFDGSQWTAICTTCPRRMVVLKEDGKWGKGIDNGHFISRGLRELRYDEYNCNIQCSHCNNWRDKESMQEAYRKAIRDKYGSDILKELKTRAKIIRSNTISELEIIISDSKAQLYHCLENPDFYRKML